MKLLSVFLLLLSFNLFAHEGHDKPGAIPPAPHGGVLAEASHSHNGSKNHDHMVASEKEIFFEGILKNGKLQIFPLQLDTKNGAVFIPVGKTEITDMVIIVKDPRKNLIVSKEYSEAKSGWIVDLSEKRGRRFIANITFLLNGAKYKATLQIERK